MPRPMTPITLALVTLVTGLPLPARGWSDAGHRIVAAIAEERLSPQAGRLLREVIGGKSISDRDVARWADGLRDARTAPWHYVNVPFSAEQYEPARDCPAAGCAVSALDLAAVRLRDADDSLELADSLRWVVHLVADLHQPMHAGELRDRGGNETWLRIGRRRQPVNLHRFWDAEVVEPLLAGADPLRAARTLAAAIGPADAAAWAPELAPAAWAEEAHRLARTIYAEL